ncbi:MAG TPA: AAA family ATPase [Dermatophilaceae bacterium]|nr:AAA family ATPase [Dermatophilaceae bacterium]
MAVVGREPELALLRARAERARAARPRLVVISADAGVGKTTVVRELVEWWASSTDERLVGVGACLPLSESLPLLPVAEAIRTLRRTDGTSVLDQVLDRVSENARYSCGRLLPELAGGGAGETHAAPLEEWARQRLLAGLRELVTEISARAPTLLVVEDLHWADAGTLDLLTLVLGGLLHERLLLVVTRRPVDPPHSPIGSWVATALRSPLAEHVVLNPLDEAGVALQAQALLGHPPAPSLVTEVFERAGGNCLYTEQLLRSGSPAGQLPPDLRAAVLAQAPERGTLSRRALDVVAAAAAEVDLGIVAAATDVDHRSAAAAVHALTDARLVAATTVGVRVRHALIGEALLADLLPDERRELHARVAEALLASDRPAAEVAEHWQRAGRPLQEVAARLRAADHAERLSAPAEIAAHLDRVLDLLDGGSIRAGEMGVDLVGLLLQAGRAHKAVGDTGRWGSLVERAVAVAAPVASPASTARAWQEVAKAGDIFGARDAQEAYDVALRLHAPLGPSTDHAEALGSKAISLFGRGDCRGAAVLFERAHVMIEGLRPGSRPDLLAWTTTMRVYLDPTASDAELGRAWQESPASDDWAARSSTARLVASTLALRGRGADAARVAADGLTHLELLGRGSSWEAHMLRWNRAGALLDLGRTNEAAAVVSDWADTTVDVDTYPSHTALARVELVRGLGTDAATRLARVTDCTSFMNKAQLASYLRLRLEVLWATGRLREALEELSRGLAQLAGTDVDFLAVPALTLAARAAADLSTAGRARRDAETEGAGLESLAQLRGRVAGMPRDPFAADAWPERGVVEQREWECEAQRAREEDTAADWSALAGSWASFGMPHRAAYARLRATEAALRQGARAGEVTEVLKVAAREAVQHARLLADITGLARRARVDLTGEHEPAREPVPAAGGFSLTCREQEVLELLAEGMTNPQIGARLFMSPKTASVHVTAILRKLGVPGRVQAAVLAERAGLVRRRA